MGVMRLWHLGLPARDADRSQLLYATSAPHSVACARTGSSGFVRDEPIRRALAELF